VLLVYNPNSGKKKNILNVIENAFFEFDNKIEIETHQTTGYLDAFNKIKDMDIDLYSAIFISGGDGSIHECVNGMMYRSDKKIIPVGIIPNGSGNDTCFCFQISTVDESLAFLKAQEVISIDLLQIILDYESEADLDAAIVKDPSIVKSDHMRYSLINSVIGMLANINKNAANKKFLFG
jgi:diacylglycerol kinase family enzyme